MPFYEYECQNCKFYSEVMQKISDEPLKKCPSCGKNALKKLISAPNFRLKGGGWYETDFKSDKENKRNLAGAEKDEAPKAAAAESSSSSDSKAAESKSTPAAASKPAAESKPSISTKAGSRSGGAKPSAKKPAARPSRPAPKKKAAKKARR
jgi:putative FmdB family regulatory protein